MNPQRNIVEQSRYTGLACLKIPTDAYNDFPDFAWAALDLVTEEQVATAQGVIDTHPWAKLANDTVALRNQGRAEKFKHAVYTAKKLYKTVLRKDSR